MKWSPSFFSLRTPLLPFDALEDWSSGLEAPSAEPEQLSEALAADRARLRERLADWVGRPEIEEALYIASPSIHKALDRWRRDPDSSKGRRCEQALVRYFVRMAARATPFGLFAGSSLGRFGGDARLELAPRSAYERHSRLDMDYVFRLAEELGRDPELRDGLVYRPNSGLYSVAGSWRYVEVRYRDAARTHHLVQVDSTDYLDELLSHAADGARRAELAASLAEMFDPGEVSEEEALGFVDELIESQLLVSDLEPPLTGPLPIDALARKLRELPAAAAVADRLDEVERELRELDQGGLGVTPASYRDVARRLEALPVRLEPGMLFQVDLAKPPRHATLSRELAEEILRGVELLFRIKQKPPRGLLERFREDFARRYGEGREVPLTEVLDDEIGIGFDSSAAPKADASPLLADLVLPSPEAPPRITWTQREGLLLRLAEAAWQEGRTAIELLPEEVEGLSSGEPLPLADAFHVLGTLAAPSPEALARGEFRFLLSHASGPPGARSLGRFCHADPELRRAVEEHARAEEAHRHGDEVYAEIVHLPQGRMGNVISRPLLREYEIPYLGRSGAPPERQIPAGDLRLSLHGETFELCSARLGRRVVPRLMCAHNYEGQGLALYRLLAFLQNQGVTPSVFWHWGPLESAAFLPAVTSGRLVLSRARWRVEAKELEPLREARGAERFRALERWRAARRLPRQVAWLEGTDQELWIDFGNVLSAESFLFGSRGRPDVTLVELFPPPEELAVHGPEGRFVHELMIPFVRSCPSEEKRKAPPESRRRVPAEPAPLDASSFAPGTEWLYAKLYTGSATVDRILVEIVKPLAEKVRSSGAADSWFFLRYGDPDWHLRLRFHGEPGALTSSVLPELGAGATASGGDESLYRLELATYEREVERYGGLDGLSVLERFFEADSDAVVRILETLEGDQGGEARWRLALVGIDLLLEDFGLAGADRLWVVERLRDETARILGAEGSKPLRLALDHKFRGARSGLEELLDPRSLPGPPPGERGEGWLAPGLAAFEERSRKTAPLWAELGELEGAGRLTRSRIEIVPSLVHMHVNRLIPSAAQAHELVLYDFLYRLYKSQAARNRS